MRDTFHADNVWQLGIRDRIIIPFYRRHFEEGRFVVIDKGGLATLIQRQYAIDTIGQGPNGGCYAIEEKIVRWPKNNVPHDRFFLETYSCTRPGRVRVGWMHYCRADRLHYCFVNEGDNSLTSYMFPFAELKRWVFANVSRFETHTLRDTVNCSAGLKVPIGELTRHVIHAKRVLMAPPEKLVLRTQMSFKEQLTTAPNWDVKPWRSA